MLTDNEIAELVQYLRTHSALDRLAHNEVLAAIRTAESAGWAFTKVQAED